MTTAPPQLRTLLDALPSRARLAELARHVGLTVNAKVTKPELVEALVRSPQVRVRGVVEWIPSLEAIGERLYEARDRFMVDTDQSLTKTYDALKYPNHDDPRVAELRALHEELDRAVVAAYGWDLPVPPCRPKEDEARAAVQAFEDQVIDKLFALNAERAEEERKAGAVVGANPRGGKKKGAEPGKAKAPKKRGGKGAAAQLKLGATRKGGDDA